MNNVALTGYLARDPELSYTPSNQTAVCKFTLAVNRPRRNGEDQGADFIRIVVWGKQAETCDQYLSKGRRAAIVGRIQTGSYKNQEGQTVYTTDVVAERVEFLGGGQQNNSVAPGPGFKDCQSSNPEQMDMDDYPDSFQATDDSVPF